MRELNYYELEQVFKELEYENQLQLAWWSLEGPVFKTRKEMREHEQMIQDEIAQENANILKQYKLLVDAVKWMRDNVIIVASGMFFCNDLLI